MLRIILGVIAGFLAWSIVWIGSDQVLASSIGWYGEHQLAFEKAMFNKEAFSPDLTILILHIFRSVIISLVSGFIATTVTSRLGSKVANIGGGSLFILAIFVFMRNSMLSSDPYFTPLQLIVISVGSLGTLFLFVWLSTFLIQEKLQSSLVLGGILLIFGIIVEISAWNYLPLWYHIGFLALLIPATIAGGKLKKFSPAVQTA